MGGCRLVAVPFVSVGRDPHLGEGNHRKLREMDPPTPHRHTEMGTGGGGDQGVVNHFGSSVGKGQ